MSIASTLCHIAIQAGGGEVELTFPADIPLITLLPGAFDVIAEAGLWTDDPLGQDLALAVPGYGPLDGRKSLTDNGIRNGAVLVLVALADQPSQPDFDRATAVSKGTQTAVDRWSPATAAVAAVLAGGCLAALLASLLIFLLLQPYSPSHLVVGAGFCALAITVMVLARRYRWSPKANCVSGIASIVLIAITAALSLPTRSVGSTVLLSVATCGVSAMGASRLLGCGTRIFTVITGISAVLSTAVFGAVLNWWAAQAIGPILILVALVLLTSAPRIALRSEYISTWTDSVPDRLTTLIVIAGASTGAGSLLLVMTGPPTPVTIGAAALANANLGLHAHRYRDIPKHASLVFSAAISGTGVVWALALAYSSTVPWLCVGVLAAAGIAYSLYRSPSDRICRALENIATASVIPLSCWAGGLFSAVRGLSFT